MVGLWSLPAASLLLLQIALSLEAPAGGKRSIYSVFCPNDEEKLVLWPYVDTMSSLRSSE